MNEPLAVLSGGTLFLIVSTQLSRADHDNS